MLIIKKSKSDPKWLKDLQLRDEVIYLCALIERATDRAYYDKVISTFPFDEQPPKHPNCKAIIELKIN